LGEFEWHCHDNARHKGDIQQRIPSKVEAALMLFNFLLFAGGHIHGRWTDECRGC
jgi:hypothetical protein